MRADTVMPPLSSIDIYILIVAATKNYKARTHKSGRVRPALLGNSNGAET